MDEHQWLAERVAEHLCRRTPRSADSAATIRLTADHMKRWYSSSFRMTVIEEHLVTPVGRRSEPTLEPRGIQRLGVPFLVSLVVLALPLLQTPQARALCGGAFNRALQSMTRLRRLPASGRVRAALPPE